MATTLDKQMAFEANRKSMGVAYLLWFLFGTLGIHRFYAGRTKSAVVMLLLTLTVFGLVVTLPWWVIDAFLLPNIVREKNFETMRLIDGGVPSGARRGDDGAPIPAQPANPKAMSKTDHRREEMLEDLRQTGYKKERRDRTF